MPDEKINVQPTKELFIYMLTRDVKLEKAIIDLIDNSIDAAINNALNDDLSPFTINITINKDEFIINDNCGGIDIKTAKEYAFKFGRPETVDKKVGNIGQFGIGMKRTIFKLGKMCQIESQSLNTKFNLTLDIEQWKIDPDDWTLQLNAENFQTPIPLKDTYTNIHITNLNKEVSANFIIQNFINELKLEIKEAHAYSLAKGLNIFVNGDRLSYNVPVLKSTDEINILMKNYVFDKDTEDEIKITLYAGIQKRDLTEAGWYIYCNNRLLVSANQNLMTGWESNGVRKFHPDFAFFRGYVFFESQNGDKLPWTTTKDGINFNSEVYQKILLEMQNSIKPILNFLSDFAKEKSLVKNDPEKIEPVLFPAITKLLEEGNDVNIKTITISQEFKSPSYSLTAPRKIGTITFSKPLSELNNIKKIYGLSTNKDIGKMTYRYFIENEME